MVTGPSFATTRLAVIVRYRTGNDASREFFCTLKLWQANFSPQFQGKFSLRAIGMPRVWRGGSAPYVSLPRVFALRGLNEVLHFSDCQRPGAGDAGVVPTIF